MVSLAMPSQLCHAILKVLGVDSCIAASYSAVDDLWHSLPPLWLVCVLAFRCAMNMDSLCSRICLLQVLQGSGLLACIHLQGTFMTFGIHYITIY